LVAHSERDGRRATSGVPIVPRACDDLAMQPALLASLGFLMVGCGGLVVIELDDGTSGGGSAAAPPSAGAPTTSGMVDPCDELLEAFEIAIDQARACSPLDAVDPCNVLAPDTCSCVSIVVNESATVELGELEAARLAWIDQGCGPFPCTECSAPKGGFCQAEGEGGKGRCTADPR
jgi:hypothetical protein